MLGSKKIKMKRNPKNPEPISREALMKTIKNLTVENEQLHRDRQAWRGGSKTKALIGSILNCECGEGISAERQAGKTTALLTIVHNRHKGRAIIVAMNYMQMELIRARYQKEYPKDVMPDVVSAAHAVKTAMRGNTLPVYCDEWWMFTEQEQRNLKEHRERLFGVVGTIPTAFKIRL
jgi:hypothetical protein